MNDELRNSLINFIKQKFYSYPNVSLLADDIVQEAYLKLLTSPGYAVDKVNFGYLSTMCIRLAYRQFMSQSRNHAQLSLDICGSTLVSEEDFTKEILTSEDTKALLDSLNVLKAIERIVVTQRYYGDFSFAEIAEANNLKLNTVLSHHRRALGKLRPKLTQLLGLGKENLNEKSTMENRPYRGKALDNRFFHC